MKVLCAIDGSAGSDAAVRLVGQLLAPGKDSITFYYSPPELRVGGPSALSDEIVRQASEALVEKVFEHSRSQLPGQLAETATTVTGRQKPRLGIIAAAKIHRPDLIAVGARGTSRFGLPRLGSVSRAVVHTADVPVLVARQRRKPENQPLEIVLCCDRNDLSRQTREFLNQFTLPENCVGRLVHVTESPFVYGIPEWLEAEARVAESDPVAAAYLEEHNEELETWRQRVKQHCGELPKAFHANAPVILEGHPGERIVKYLDSEKIDLVVVGANVLYPLTRTLAGSTAEHVLTHASCAVLIVPHHELP